MTSEADQIIGLYERHADAYDRLRGRGLFEKSWLDRFLALVPRGGSVLDLGCGMGEPIARYMIGNGHAVTGIDSSSHLIALCKARYPTQTWHVADMRVLALGRRFDGLLAWDSFFHLTADDQRGMFKMFADHAAPQAVLMFTSGPSHGEAIGTSRASRCITQASMPRNTGCCSVSMALLLSLMSPRTPNAVATRSGWPGLPSLCLM